MKTVPKINEAGVSYCKMPDGTLIQWGSYHSKDASADYVITFPTQFSDINYSISYSIYWFSTHYYLLFFEENKENIKFVARNTETDSNLSSTETIGGRWMAIGRWK